MEEEPPVTPDTPETPENPETPTPEDNDSMVEESPASPENPETPTTETSHATRNTIIIVVVIVVVIAVVLALFFGLRGCNDDEPDEVSPDPEIVEPGPVEDPDDGDDDGEEEDLIPSSMVVTGNDDLVVYWYSNANSLAPITLDLRDTLTVMVLDQFGNEYTGPYGGSEYRLSTTSSEYITLDGEGVVTGVSEGTATVTVTSVANTSLTEDIEIEVTEFLEVESISVSIDGEINDDGYVVLDWGQTSEELQVTFNPSDAVIQTYEVTSQSGDSLFTYNEITHTFTHTKLNTGTETFTITATDDSYNASATITLECDPVIDEPYEVVWKEESPLPETIAKGESIENLDEYVEVHYNHENQDPNEYEDDTYTLSFAGSDGVNIEGSKAIFTGDGGTTQYITVTATPEHDDGNPVYARSSNIVITQAITSVTLNHDSLVLLYSGTDASFDKTKELEITIEPEDYYPNDVEVSWSINNDGERVISITPDEDDNTKCSVTPLSKGETTVIVSLGNSEIGSCNVTVYDVDCCSFATDPWDLINEICTEGLASTYYNIGDTKTITINGESHDIRIIDFDHDDLTTADEEYHSGYGYNDGEHAAMTCEMVDCLSTTHNMNNIIINSPTNSGGWYTCDMRKYLNTDEGCVLSTLDSDLQAVIKKVDKNATAGNVSTEIVTSSDSLFLLARVELDGTTDSGYKDEGTQYAYWSNHNNDSDRIKKYNGSVVEYWWLRSPRTEDSVTFRIVYQDGQIVYFGANSAYYVSFAFCI